MKILGTFHRFWPLLLLYGVLGSTPLIVGHFCGRQWKLPLAGIALGIWLLVRPWRLSFLASDESPQVMWAGTIGLAGLVVNYAVIHFHL